MIPSAVRVAVISDIHANLHALAVLRDVDAASPDEVWCPRRHGRIRARAPMRSSTWSASARTCSSETTTWPPSATSTWPPSRPTRPSRPGGLRPSWRRTPRSSRHAHPADTRAASRSSTKRHASRLGVRAHGGVRARHAFERAGTQLALVGHSHVALAICFEGEVASEAACNPGTTYDVTPGRWPQPGLGRTAARRRPASRVVAARRRRQVGNFAASHIPSSKRRRSYGARAFPRARARLSYGL